MTSSPGEVDRAPIALNLVDCSSTARLSEKPIYDHNYPAKRSSTTTDDHEYDPFAHRSVANPTSTFGALAHMLKGSLGSGILAMPMAFKNAGLVFGIVGTLVACLICTHCVNLLVQVSRDVCRRTRTPSLGFAETAERVFESGPRALRPWSNVAKQFCDFGLMATYFSADCVYIVFVANSLQLVVNYQLSVELNVRVYIAIVLLPCMIIGQIRVLKYLVPFSMMANVLIAATFGITMYYMFNEPLRYDDKPLMAEWSRLPFFFATVIFAMEGIGSVLPVENEMEKPQHFLGCPGVLNVAMGTVVVLYTVIGFFGYVRFGENVQGSVTLNLPPNETLATVGQVMIAFAILFTFGLQFYVPSDILWTKIRDKVPVQRHNAAQICIRIGCIFVIGATSMAVPKLGPFIGLVGAIFISTLGLIVPSVLQTVFLWPDTGRFHWILIKNVLLFVIGLFALVTGTWVSVLDIYKAYAHIDGP